MAPSASKEKLPTLPSKLPPPDKVTKSTLQELSGAYSVAASRLLPASKQAYVTKDQFRFDELPALIASRRGKPPKGADKEWTSGWLEKADLEKLMDWKLHRGTYRPSLPGLIKSNSADDVIRATASALSQLDTSLSTNSYPKSALKTAATLRGVGPATASLILAAAHPEAAPFMADQVYAWLCGGGRKPEKYNDKELEALWNAVSKLRKRAGVDAVDIEKAVACQAWGREGKVEGWNAGGEVEEDEDDEEDDEQEEEETERKGEKRGKQKADDKKRKVDASEDDKQAKPEAKTKTRQSARTSKKRRGS